MTDPRLDALGPGDLAPDFTLPAADVEGNVALAEYLRRGPVFLTMLRGLYCPFCRRHISQLRPTCEALRDAGVAVLGVVLASPERARQYFSRFPPCFPIAAAPDRAIHRAFGLPELTRTPEFGQETERRAADFLREVGQGAPPGQASSLFITYDAFEITSEDRAELRRPIPTVASFLIGTDGRIRWARIDPWIVPLPRTEELLSLI
jgi:peroxiredoxin